MQGILNQDKGFTQYLIKEHGCTSPAGKIGLERADDFMEAIIGAVFLTNGYKTSKIMF
jgi:dsRNA-specific ribonuclease